MATYSVTYSQDDDWGESSNRFKTRTEAEVRLKEVEATGVFARLVVGSKNQPTEVLRVNDNTGQVGEP